MTDTSSSIDKRLAKLRALLHQEPKTIQPGYLTFLLSKKAELWRRKERLDEEIANWQHAYDSYRDHLKMKRK